MSNDKQPHKQPRTGPERIAVRVLTFRDPHPSFGGMGSLTSDLTHANRNHYVIEYVPSMRHHRVEYRPIDGKPRVTFIHETHAASWEPMV